MALKSWSMSSATALKTFVWAWTAEPTIKSRRRRAKGFFILFLFEVECQFAVHAVGVAGGEEMGGADPALLRVVGIEGQREHKGFQVFLRGGDILPEAFVLWGLTGLFQIVPRYLFEQGLQGVVIF